MPLIEALLPFKESWAKNGQVSTPNAFASAEAVSRALSELFACRRLYLNVLQNESFPLPQPLLSYPAFLHCNDVEVLNTPIRLTVEGIADWLHHPNGFDEPKKLDMCEDDVRVDQLLDLLKKVGTAFGDCADCTS